MGVPLESPPYSYLPSKDPAHCPLRTLALSPPTTRKLLAGLWAQEVGTFLPWAPVRPRKSRLLLRGPVCSPAQHLCYSWRLPLFWLGAAPRIDAEHLPMSMSNSVSGS